MHVTFDTMNAVRRLESKGYTRQQAEEVVEVIKDAQSELFTKKDAEIMKKDLLISLGLMIAAATSILGALIKFF